MVERESGVPMLCVTGRYAVERSKADQRVLFERLFKDANPRYADLRPGQVQAARASGVRSVQAVRVPS